MNADELKSTIDLAAYIESCGIELKKKGRDQVGLCPFHEDTTPSFVVSPRNTANDVDLWHCMGCGKGGSVIDFVMEREGLSLADALKQLSTSSTTSPSLSSTSISAEKDKVVIPPERARQLLERAVVYYEKKLSECDAAQSTPAIDYLTSRGLMAAGGTLLARMRVGYCDGSLLSILPSPSTGSGQAEGGVLEELASIGILIEGKQAYTERFKGCLVFPVFDLDGSIATLYGRCIDPESTKRHVYLPDRPTGFWNISVAKSSHEVILVESVLDALSVMVSGFQNVISIQGTNGMTAEGVSVIKACGVSTIRLLLDGDAAGCKAAERITELLESDPGIACETLVLPDDHDPNSYLMAHGPSKLATFINQHPPQHRTQSASTKLKPTLPPKPIAGGGLQVTTGNRTYCLFGVEKGARKLRVTVRLEHGGKLHIDTLDLYSARARQQLTRDLCRVFEQAPEAIEADLNRLVVACESDTAQADSANDDETQGQTRVEISEPDRKAARKLAADPDLVNRILADFEACGLVGEEINKLLCYLAMTSRKTSAPLSILILSSSGAGKTALQDGALAFCPPEDLVKLTSLSGKALFYKERHSLKHKVLALEEGAGAEDASYAIRNLISADSLTTESTMRDPASGKLTTMENTVEGPTSVFVTTTNPEVDAETKSRFLVTGVDESREQTRRILAFQRQRHSQDGLQENLHRPDILHLHRNFQRILRQLQVVNPFADTMTYSDDRLQSRRLQPQYLSLVGAVAFLRQYQKEVKTSNGCEYIEVDAVDLELGNRLAIEILGRTLDELSIPARNLLDQLLAMVTERVDQQKEAEPDRIPRTTYIPFTRKEIREYTGWTQTRTRTHLKELIELEYIMISGSPNGRSLQLYYLLYEGEGQDGQPFIPGLEPI